MRKIFHSFILPLFMSVIVLGMASCGDENDPFAGKPFHIFVRDITPEGATLQINPTDKEALYFWAIGLADDVDSYNSMEEYIRHYYQGSGSKADKGAVEYVIPSVGSGYTANLKSNTEYVVVVFKIDENDAPIYESAVTWRFTTLPPEGALKGYFSVSAYDQVLFSKGNLYYDRALKTYYFHDNQWDYLGKNGDYSSSGTGKIDLFGWGTGNAPEKTSTSNSDYISFSEWGNYKIANGGNDYQLWRTLTYNEWYFLCRERKNAAKLIGLGIVHGVNGLIILPDNWQPIEGAPVFNPVSESEMVWVSKESEYYDSDSQHCNHFEDNKYTDQEWEAMENSGALFLPAAGDRIDEGGKRVNAPGLFGSYWAKDEATATYWRYKIYFANYRLGLLGRSDCHNGMSVRLVRKGN